MFNVGQKVVRTRERAVDIRGGNLDPAVCGEVYTVATLFVDDDAIPSLTLVEITGRYSWICTLFRPVAFDFDALLATKPEDAPLVEMDMEIEARVRELNQVWSA